eukprot:CAMPEP_0194042634 /NCGR_PEP_ID=MMETSP0009_2-20130614/14394_1 /TAXON_ID=210454 /ORGANISM="Grammatophora oceanica, Strain CCMP 410" /LENGTH=33 /DNA_ID= /DNA_START= /DNA_END= /DNA_ORIENTATION=
MTPSSELSLRVSQKQEQQRVSILWLGMLHSSIF